MTTTLLAVGAVPIVLAPLIVTLDKYAPYIIGSYAATAAIFGALIVYLTLRNAAVRRRLAEAERRRDGAADASSRIAANRAAPTTRADERPAPSLEQERP